jgi:SAM-dependent methyltransferase
VQGIVRLFNINRGKSIAMTAVQTNSTQALVDASTVEMFQRSWNIYRKMVDNNFLFHREAYSCLHQFLVEDVARPFRFLDIACGDASASAGALKGTQIVHYRGIDFSASALELAKVALGELKCTIKFEQLDFSEALSGVEESEDIVFIGLSLHHLRSPEKLQFMRQIRHALIKGGSLVIYENTSPEGEDRTSWMRRWDLQKPLWTAYSEDEWNAMAAHVHAADFPETDAAWKALGHDAGFAETLELYMTPSDLFRMYCFRA